MDISFKKMFAGVSAVAASVALMGSAVAAYSDVPAGAWYKEAVDAFTDAGYLDGTQTRFRGGDLANRAEFTKLVVELNGGILSTPPAVPSFDDAAPGAWYYGYMEEAGKEGWVKGDGNCYGRHPCYARPSANVNRAEAAALIVRAFGLESTGDAPQFVDNASGQWYTDVIQTAADACVLQGNDGRVRPADSMNRAEMVTMLYRVDQNLTYGVDCGTDSTTEPIVKGASATSASTVEVEFNVDLDSSAALMASNYSVTDEDGNSVTVSSVSKVNDSTVELTLSSSLSAGTMYTVSVEDMKTADGDMFSDTADFEGFSPIVKGDGVLEVSLAANNPSGDTVPRGAVGVTLASLDLSASCDDSVSIQELTVLHEGFGDESDIDGLYAAVDGARVTRKRTIDSQDQTSDLRFSLPLTVPACGTVTVDVMADFNSTATVSAEHNIAVELPTDIRSNAKDVTGNFPLRGSTFRLAAVTSGKVTVSYRTVSPDKVEVGQEKVTIGRFELSTDSVEDQTIYSMTFEQNGSAGDGDLTNIRVARSDGTVLTNIAATTVGDFVTLVFDPPFTILQGDKVTLSVLADVEGGAGETVVAHFEETSDLFAVGSLYGYGVNGQLYGSQVSIPTDNADTVTIDAGQFTIEIDGPVQQKYTRDDNNAVLANIKFTTGGEAVDIKRLFIAVQAQTSTGQGLGVNAAGTSDDNVHEIIENIQIRNKTTGQTISAVRLTGATDFGTGNSSTSSYQVYRFDDFVISGNEVWELRADFINNGATSHPKNGDRFRAIICGEPTQVLDTSNALTDNTTGCTFGILGTASESYQMEIEGLSTGDEVGDVRPRGNITGNFHRIATPELNITVRGSIATNLAVKNSKDINLLKFEARAGEAEDVLLTKAVFKATSGSLLNAQNYSLWADSDGDSIVDTKVESGAPVQSTSVTFDDLASGGYVIPAEQTVVFELHADIVASLVNNDLQVNFSTGSTDFIEAEQVDNGSSLSGFRYYNATNVNGVALNSATSTDINVRSGASTNFELISQGDLFVTEDTDELRNRQLLAGTTADAILGLKFSARNEDVDVTNLQITSSGSAAGSVNQLELYKFGAATPFAIATPSCGTEDTPSSDQNGNTSVTTFCVSMQSRQLVVPKGGDVRVLVRPSLFDDAHGAVRNQTVALFLTGQAVASTGSGAVRARGLQSSSDLTANDGDTSAEGEIFLGTTSATTNSKIYGNKNVVTFAKLESLTNAGETTGAIVTNLAPIARFRFKAMPNSNGQDGTNQWTLSGVIFNVTASNVMMNSSNFNIYNTGNENDKHNCTPVNSAGTAITNVSSGSFLVVCNNVHNNITATLESGASMTLVLEGEVTDDDIANNAGSSTLQVSLRNLSNIGYSTMTTSTSHINWLDKDASTVEFFWIETPSQVDGTTYRRS